MRNTKKNMETAKNLLVKPIERLTIKEYNDLTKLIDQYRSFFMTKTRDEANSKYLKGREAYERQKAKKAEERNYILRFVKEHLKAGDIVALSGTKGSRYRRLYKIEDSTLYGIVLSKDRKTDEFVDTEYSSSNDIGKLTHWFDANNGRWVDRKLMVHLGKTLYRLDEIGVK